MILTVLKQTLPVSHGQRIVYYRQEIEGRSDFVYLRVISVQQSYWDGAFLSTRVLFYNKFSLHGYQYIHNNDCFFFFFKQIGILKSKTPNRLKKINLDLVFLFTIIK